MIDNLENIRIRFENPTNNELFHNFNEHRGTRKKYNEIFMISE